VSFDIYPDTFSDESDKAKPVVLHAGKIGYIAIATTSKMAVRVLLARLMYQPLTEIKIERIKMPVYLIR